MRTHQAAPVAAERASRGEVHRQASAAMFAPSPPERVAALGHRFTAEPSAHARTPVLQLAKKGRGRNKQKARKQAKAAALQEAAENYDATFTKLRAETALRNIPSAHVRGQLEEGIDKIKRSSKGEARKHGTKLVSRLGKAYGIRHAPDPASYDPDVPDLGVTLPGKYVKLGPRALRDRVPRTDTALGGLRNLAAASTLGHETLHSLYARRVGSILPSVGRAGVATAVDAEADYKGAVKRLKLAQAAVSRRNLAGKPAGEVERLRAELRDRKKEHRVARDGFHQARNLGKRLTAIARREHGFEEGLAYQQNIEHQQHFRERAYGPDGPPAEDAAALDALGSESTSLQARYLSSLTDEQRSLFHAGRYGEALARIRKKVHPDIIEELITRKT